MAKPKTKQTSASKSVLVKKSQLPLSCPTPDVALWSAHPKVYLPLDKTGREVCPYCGTEFILQDD